MSLQNNNVVTWDVATLGEAQTSMSQAASSLEEAQADVESACTSMREGIVCSDAISAQLDSALQIIKNNVDVITQDARSLANSIAEAHDTAESKEKASEKVAAAGLAWGNWY